jgi:hypothetical protein
MPGSGTTAQSECVFLLFGMKLVQFSSNFFDLDAIFLVSGLFLISEKGFAIHGYFSAKNWLFLPFGKKTSYSWD